MEEGKLPHEFVNSMDTGAYEFSLPNTLVNKMVPFYIDVHA
jgi:hypothetical protein